MSLTPEQQDKLDSIKSKLKKVSILRKLLADNSTLFDAKELVLAKLEGILKEEMPKISEKKLSKIKERVLKEILGAI